MSGLLTLAGIATAVAALVLCGNDIRWRWYGYMDIDRMCGRSPSPDTTSDYGWGQGWRQQSSYGDPRWLENECRKYMEMLTVRTGRGPGRRLLRPHPKQDVLTQAGDIPRPSREEDSQNQSREGPRGDVSEQVSGATARLCRGDTPRSRVLAFADRFL